MLLYKISDAIVFNALKKINMDILKSPKLMVKF